MFGDWTSVSSLDDALSKLYEKEYVIFAGGTDLMVKNRAGLINEAPVLDINNLKNSLGEIELVDINGKQFVKIGAMVTHDRIVNDELINKYLPALSKASDSVGSPQIRRRGTVGGNICNASPAADTVPALVALNAEVELISKDSSRRIALCDFIKSPGKTDRLSKELLCYIYVPIDAMSYELKYVKIGKRNAMAISIVSVVAVYNKDELRISFGSVSASPKRAVNLEALWANKDTVTKEEITAALQNDISPIDDSRATGEYRFDMACEAAYEIFEVK